MRIGIDARPLSYTLTGIGFYLKHLLDAFQQLDSMNEYYLISNAPIDYRPKHHNWHKIEGNLHRKLLSTAWMQTMGVFWSLKAKIDVFWSPRHHLPLLLPSSIKTVLTVHDLVHSRYPETMALPNLLVEKLLLGRSIARSDAVITDSLSTANDIRSVYGPNMGKLHTIHPGVPELIDDRNLKPDIGKPLPETYFLFVGTLDPRKNFDRILKAFARINPIQRNLHLLMVGGEGWRNKGFFQRLNGHPCKSNIHVTGYISRQNLAALYRHALGLLFPSVYEGFGFPILEAMSLGTPVITSNLSSMPEIAGDAALLVNPHEVEAIAGAMNTIAENLNLRESLIEKGFQQVNRFSWKKCAEETLGLITRVFYQ